jgi:hypothetical protein
MEFASSVNLHVYAPRLLRACVFVGACQGLKWPRYILSGGTASIKSCRYLSTPPSTKSDHHSLPIYPNPTPLCKLGRPYCAQNFQYRLRLMSKRSYDSSAHEKRISKYRINDDDLFEYVCISQHRPPHVIDFSRIPDIDMSFV